MPAPPLLLALLLAGWPPPRPTPAPYHLALTEPDQELDGFTFRFKGIHRLSSRLRGVRGAHHTVYWVSANGQCLTAYQLGRRQWQTDVAKVFRQTVPGARITTLLFCSNTVFVRVPHGGYAELNRQTGAVQASGFDPE